MLTTLALLWTPAAHAMSCADIMNMVNVNVPTSIVVQTIEESGDSFSADDVRCLTNEGAPPEIVAAAKSQMAKALPREEVQEEPDAPAPKKPAEDSDFDSAEGIGDKKSSSKGGALRDLPEEGGEDEGGGPNEIEQARRALEAKKPLTASLMLYDVLCPPDEREAVRRGDKKECTPKYPQSETVAQFYLARSLYDLGMYHGAQYYFIEVLKKGPSTPYFKNALGKLVAISHYTGDESDLSRVVAKIPVDVYKDDPSILRIAGSTLYYALGVREYEKGNLTEARKYFGQVSEKSDLYTRSKYFEGVIYNKQGKLKSAVRSFMDVANFNAEAKTQQELQDLDRLRDLSLMNVARIYYSIQRYDQAKQYFELVPHDSSYWPQTLFESAWTNFMLSDLNLSLGQLLTVSSPFYAEQEFIPEATILRALTFFNLCEYKDVEHILLEFDAEYRPMQAELKEILKQYSTEEGRKLADQAFERYFEGKGQTTLPKSMFSRFLRNQELAGLVTHLQVMDKEEALIDQQKTQWKDALGEELHRIVAADRERLKRRAGLVMLQEMASTSNYLGDLLGQAEIIRFELVDATRADYIYRAQQQDIGDTSNEFNIDFATSGDRIYWPFNGEFWQDELGYYWYTEQGSCK